MRTNNRMMMMTKIQIKMTHNSQAWARRNKPNKIRRRRPSRMLRRKHCKSSSKQKNLRRKRPNNVRKCLSENKKPRFTKSKSRLKRKSCKLKLWSSRRRIWSCLIWRLWMLIIIVRIEVHHKLMRCAYPRRSNFSEMNHMMLKSQNEAAQGEHPWPPATKPNRTEL